MEFLNDLQNKVLQGISEVTGDNSTNLLDHHKRSRKRFKV